MQPDTEHAIVIRELDALCFERGLNRSERCDHRLTGYRDARLNAFDHTQGHNGFPRKVASVPYQEGASRSDL
jgi:hypothetical protein